MIVVHGGAGAARPNAPDEPAMRRGLQRALEQGQKQLLGGAPALDVVESSVRLLEADPLFNAGHGSVLNSAGEVEMDACIMDGATREAGAVCCVRRLAHPVSGARLVLAGRRHVLLAGVGAEAFALAAGAEKTEPSSLVTTQRREQLERARRRAELALDHDGGGTVGAVALDAHGHLAAATSTGGMTNKLPGRVSDSALVGSGTWADDASCAVSTTGHGESMIRAAVAHEVSALLRLEGLSLEEACARALDGQRELGGSGGLIAVDRKGRSAALFTTPALYRGWVAGKGTPKVAIFSEE